MRDSGQNKLESGKISKLVFSYTFATLSGLILNSIYNLTDSLFVSWGIGDNATGGISIVYPFVLIQSAIATALGGGAASIVSRMIGKGDLEKAAETVFNARIVFYPVAILITAVGFLLMEPTLKAFGATEELYQYAKDYYTIILLGNIFSTGFSAMIRAEGKMLYGILIWVIPIALNIVLDAVFILVFGWGVKGAALATVSCQFISFCMSVLFFAKFSIHKRKKKKLRPKTIGDILLMGLPALVQSAILSLSLLLINNILKYSQGTLAINTFSYINKLIMLAMIPFLALTQGISPIIGYNYGAKNPERLQKTIHIAFLISGVYALLSLALLESVPGFLLMIFTRNEDIIKLGTNALRILAAAMPFLPLPMILGAAYQAEGKKLQSLLIYSANLFFLLICEIVLSAAIGLTGVWWGYVTAHALTTLTAAVFFYLSRKRLFG